MKRIFYRTIGKTILAAAVIFWNLRTNWTFKLNQKLTRIALTLNNKHNLDLWDEKDSEEDSNRF